MDISILVIDNRDGRYLSAHASETEARSELLEYVKANWAHRASPVMEMPGDPDTAIDLYLLMSEESCTVTTVPLQGLELEDEPGLYP